MSIFWAVLLILAVLAGWLLTLFNMPGNWVIVLAAVLFAWLVPPDKSRLAIEWPWLVALGVLALLGELAELAASALGVARVGGSKRGAALAVAGSVVGSIVGALVGFPVPFIGPIVGVLLFAAVGALAGAMLGEHWKGRSLGESWQVGQGAFWGRLLGSLAKVTIATLMVIVTLVAMPIPLN